MISCNSKRLDKFFVFSIKLIVLTSFLITQLSLSEIFLYQNNPGNKSIHIASAATADPWYDTAYPYRKQINLTGSGSALTNYQVKLTVNFVSGKMKADFSDLRFTDANGTTLYSYFIESKTDSVSADVWVKVNSILTAGTYVYMYYGNSGASAVSSGGNTFDFFDDFNGTSLDESKWTGVGTYGSTNVSNSNVSISSGGGFEQSITSKTSFGTNTGIVYRAYIPSENGVIAGYTSGSDSLKWSGWFGFYSSTTTSGGSSSADDGSSYNSGFHIWEIDRNGSTSGIFKINGGTLHTFNANIPTANLPIYFSAYAVNSNWIIIDWVGVRQYASPEPSPTFSAEESYSLSPLSAWSYRKAITIDSSKVSGASNLSNFPVLINLPADSDLQNHARTDGSDILFVPANVAWDTGSQSNQLNYEIESYDSASGSLQAWVKIPILYSSNNSPTTTFYMYYGNGSASSNTVANMQGVWDSNYKMVQHMNQNPAGASPQMRDSTGNGNNGTSNGSMTSGQSVTGEVGKGVQFDGSNDYMTLPQGALNNKTRGTISAWFKTTDTTGAILTQYSMSGSYGYLFNIDGSKIKACLSTNNNTCADPTDFDVSYGTNVNDNVWHYASANYDGANVILYVDGVQRSSLAKTGTISYYVDYGNIIGSQGYIYGSLTTQGDGYLSGNIDEVRISDAARSADWISAEYNNQSTTPAAGNFILPLSAEQNNLPSVLTQIAPVPALTNDPTPDYTFNSTKAGTITYGANCSSSTTSAIAGDNTITFNSLADGAHSCTVRVTNPEGNDSNTLSVPSFTIDTNPPSALTLLSPLSNASISVMTPSFSWSNSSDTSNIQKYQLYLDGVMDRDGLSLTATTSSGELSCGDHRWNVIAFDNAGNATSSFVSNFNIGCAVGFSQPVKPIISLSDLVNGNIPANIIQIAVSTTPDFKNVSWEDISKKDELLKGYANIGKLFIKFRSQGGGVSETLIWERSSSGDKDISLNEGDIVKTPSNPDVYIIKYKNNKQFKRLILSPSVFKSYGHLKWSNLKIISQSQMDANSTSALVQVAGDSNLYELTPLGDTGERKVLDISKSYDANSVYEINAVDRDSYRLVK